MLNSRRNFIKHVGGISIGLSGLTVFNPLLANSIKDEALKFKDASPKDLASNEDFWYQIQKAYRQSPHFVNLESGYFSPQPMEVMEAQMANIKMINEQPSFYMRTRQQEERLGIKKKLAAFAGVSHEEIVITRNTTEALNTVILGMNLKQGDEALMTNQDYGSMLQAFEQRALRDGIKNNVISIPLWPKSKMEVVKTFEKAITPRTKVILVSHMINLTGQILPVKEISKMAHERGIEVISDSAHAFAHVDFKIPELGCDYLGTSLHKWLCCPLGAGMLYMKKEKIANVWPLFADTGYEPDDIRKFEHIGTHPVSTNLTIASAINFHNAIGSKRKEERLRYLKDYWTSKVKDLSGVTINTPLTQEQSCGLANIAIDGKTPNELAKYFFDEFKIFTVGINREDVKGVRVTPHLYTRIEDLDLLIKAINKAVI